MSCMCLAGGENIDINAFGLRKANAAPAFDLAVFSACDSGAGGLTNSGLAVFPFLSFTWGAKTVLVSMWEAPDELTSVMMARFHLMLRHARTNHLALSPVDAFATCQRDAAVCNLLHRRAIHNILSDAKRSPDQALRDIDTVVSSAREEAKEWLEPEPGDILVADVDALPDPSQWATFIVFGV
jgi:CHAT domain-containing protein